jgi:hypothetical protein
MWRLSPYRHTIQRFNWKRLFRWVVYLLATVQFAGTYYFLEDNYLDYNRFEHGYERLPFQTRLLLAPLFRWADDNDFMVKYASHLSINTYFFPHGIAPQDILAFYLNIVCVLIAGWVAVRLYAAATRRRLLGEFVYPVFLALCFMAYILHTVQNYRFVYDLPSLAFFSIGLYLIYFRKSSFWFIALFAVATLNRETSLLLLPFYVLSQLLDERGRLEWKRLYSLRVAGVALPLMLYWVVWHGIIFHLFATNPSEYYSRLLANLNTFKALRFYPQMFSILGYLPVFLWLNRKRLEDPQLRLWMWALPVWFSFMLMWGILVETRIFGELIPFTACISVIMAEEVVVLRLGRRETTELPSESSREEEESMVQMA